MNVIDCNVIALKTIEQGAGKLSLVQNATGAIPFDVKRIFYLYDIPGGSDRGAHAHKVCHQFLIAASGSFEVCVNDGFTEKRISLNRPNLGLHIPPGIWASEINFSSGAICLVLASELFKESDYIREYSKFKEYLNEI